jgi:hypothetical protein
MGSFTRKMRKRAPVEPYAVKRLPATPARGRVSVEGKAIEVIGGSLTVDRPGHQLTFVRAEAATLSKAVSFQPGPPSLVFPARAPAPRGRPSPMQLVALMAMLCGLNSERR